MLLSVPQGQFQLVRMPPSHPQQLQAWDSADEYLLNYVASEVDPSLTGPVLIVNDSFGALATALSPLEPHALSDSFLSQQATRYNLAQNGLPVDSVHLISSLEPLKGVYGLVLIKVPKTLALLEHQLISLRPYLSPSSQVVLGGMVKNLSPSVWNMTKQLIGPTSTSLARKKARLIFTSPDPDLPLTPNPYPVCYTLENTHYLICNHANVFSRDQLDIGTRFLLQHLPCNNTYRDIIDLGCGNGVVGLIAAERNPDAILHFVDESYMAVASASDNFSRAFGQQRTASFTVGDRLGNFQPDSADLILCNPPFHLQHAIGDQVAFGMIKQSRNILRENGELWIIGNRHLHYHRLIDRFFGSHSVIAANPKFVIVKTSKKSGRRHKLSHLNSAKGR